jgi:hypothetical protein
MDRIGRIDGEPVAAQDTGFLGKQIDPARGRTVAAHIAPRSSLGDLACGLVLAMSVSSRCTANRLSMPSACSAATSSTVSTAPFLMTRPGRRWVWALTRPMPQRPASCGRSR